jgi:hypothetical protein
MAYSVNRYFSTLAQGPPKALGLKDFGGPKSFSSRPPAPPF